MLGHHHLTILSTYMDFVNSHTIMHNVVWNTLHVSWNCLLVVAIMNLYFEEILKNQHLCTAVTLPPAVSGERSRSECPCVCEAEVSLIFGVVARKYYSLLATWLEVGYLFP